MTILNKLLIYKEEKICRDCNKGVCFYCNGTTKIISASTTTLLFNLVIVIGVFISGLSITDGGNTELRWLSILFFFLFSTIAVLSLKENKEQTNSK